MGLRLRGSVSAARRRLPFISAVGAFLLASVGQCLLNRRTHEQVAVVLFVVAWALTLVAFLRVPQRKEEAGELPASRWNRRGTMALLVASVPAWVASAVLVLRWDHLHTVVPLYVLSMTAVGLVCFRWEGWKLPGRNWFREHWGCVILVVLVLGFGLFLRVHRLDHYPPPGGISWNDEAQIGKEAYGIIHHGYRPWQFPVSVYATFLSFQMLGATVFALRLPFVVLGSLTLVVFYLLARELFRFPVALAATFLFAVSRWHIAFSRLVLPSTPAMLLEVATLYLLLRGRRTGGMMSYVLAGLTMSLGLYSHASFRIVLLLVLVLFLGDAWSAWRSGAGRSVGQVANLLYVMRRGWLAFLVSTILFTAPFVGIVVREPYRAFGERFNAVMPVVFGGGGDRASYLGTVLHHSRQALGFFNYAGEAWGAVNLPDLPMLDPCTGVLFVLGLGYCLFYCWRSNHPFYLAWFLITMIGGGVLTVDFRSHRFAGVMPVLFIFAGVFIEGAWSAFRRGFGDSRQGYFAFVLLPVMVFAGYSNYHTFFYRQIDAAVVRVEFTREVSAIASYMASLGEGRYFYLFANHPFYSPGMDFAWMAGEPPGERAQNVLDAIPSHREGSDEELVYVFSTPYNVDALAEAVRHFYPQAVLQTFHGRYERYTFVSARVPAAEARRAQGLKGVYYSAHDASGEPVLTRQDDQLSFDWRSDHPPVPLPFRVEWTGSVYAPRSGPYLFQAEGTGQVQVYVDQQPLLDGQEVRLVKGWHTLRVDYASGEEEGALRLIWSSPHRARQVVPRGFLRPSTEVNGLLCSYFEGPEWRGEPVQQSIEPVMALRWMPTGWQSAPLPELAGKLYSLDCQGQLNVDQAGSYRFQVLPWQGVATLYIDGEQVAAVEDPITVTGGGELELSQGWHDVQLRYSYRGGEFSGVQLSWTPPGRETRVIPAGALRPGHGVIAERGG